MGTLTVPPAAAIGRSWAVPRGVALTYNATRDVLSLIEEHGARVSIADLAIPFLSWPIMTARVVRAFTPLGAVSSFAVADIPMSLTHGIRGNGLAIDVARRRVFTVGAVAPVMVLHLLQY